MKIVKVDDYIARGHTIQQLKALAVSFDEILRTDKRKGNYIVETGDGKLKLALAKLATDLLCEFHFSTLRDTDEVRVYHDGVWKFGGEVFIRRECQQRVGVNEVLTSHKVEEVIGHIQRTTYTDRRILNPNKWLINLNNGLLNVHTRELKPHTPEFLSTIRIPVTYDPNADCPRIRQFFNEVLNPEDVPVIEELFGYALVPDYSIQKAFLFVGGGSNGKSTTTNLLKRFIGKDNCSVVPWHALELNRFAKSALEGKLLNLFADIPSQSLGFTTSFKMLTGGDPIGAEKKFRPPYSFDNFARLVFSANKPPKVYDDDSYAFWRRWIILNFPNQFEGEKEDKNLLMKLTTETELSGLLNLALAGLSRLQKNQSYSYTKSVDETTELYQRAADPVFAFLLDTCEVSPGEWVAKGQLYELFKLYCEKHRIPILKPNSFARALQNQTQIKVSSTRPEVDGKRITAWQGVKCVKDVKDVNVSPLLKPSETKSNTHNKDNGIKVSLRYRNNIDIPDNPDGKPAHPCYACGSDDWWQRPDGGWVCGVCHPKPGEHDEEDEITQFLDEVGREMQPREEPPEEAGEDLCWLQ